MKKLKIVERIVLKEVKKAKTDYEKGLPKKKKKK